MDAFETRQKTLKKFEKEAGVYEKTPDGKFCSRIYPSIISEINATPFSSLLDIGCGTGSILSGITGNAELFGIDFSGQMIEKARKSLKDKAKFVVGDAEFLPWADGYFDTVCCTFSFHHYPNPEKVLSEINRVLKSKGRFILADPWLPHLVSMLTNRFLCYSDGGDYHIYSSYEIKRLLGKSGFSLQSFKHPSNDSFLLTAQKTGGKENA